MSLFPKENTSTSSRLLQNDSIEGKHQFGDVAGEKWKVRKHSHDKATLIVGASQRSKMGKRRAVVHGAGKVRSTKGH
jgi:hypothetical protein